jgi:hypothetical protein
VTGPIGWQLASVQSAARLHMQLGMHAERNSEEWSGDIFLLLFNLSVRPPWERVVVGPLSSPLDSRQGPSRPCAEAILKHMAHAREKHSLGTR